MTHPHEKVVRFPGEHPLADLRSVTEALHVALVLGFDADAPNEQELAELVWFASRAKAEAIAALAQKLGVDDYDIREVLADPPFADPDEHPELAARLNSLVDGLVSDL